MVDIYQLALSKTYGIGPQSAKTLMENLGSAKALFELKENDLRDIFKTREQTIQEILSRKMFDMCEKELEFLDKYHINSFFFTDEKYPMRLKQIPDMPICLFIQGDYEILEYPRIVAVVGSRKCTDYGKGVVGEVIEELKDLGAVVISGLAYGIDATAHSCCLNLNVPTFAVMGTGLDNIYPPENLEIAKRMIDSTGGLITEYFTHTRPVPHNFPARNRIIAGLSDAVVVVEATKTGGALLTAHLANDYNREVLAVPGRVNDKNSEGCNFLISSQRATIYSNKESIERVMSWNKHQTIHSLFSQEETDKGENLTGLDKKIYYTLKQEGEMDVDTLLVKMGVSSNELSASLLNLELCDIILSKPGKIYKAL